MKTFLTSPAPIPASDPRPSSWAKPCLFGRLAAALAILLTCPLILFPVYRARRRGSRAVRPLLAVRPRRADQVAEGEATDTLVYYELTCGQGWLRRWPQLWSIVQGDFRWVGNRPLNPFQAAGLANEFERLWLAAPLGLFCLADATLRDRRFLSATDRAQACAYATEADWRLNGFILLRVLGRALLSHPLEWLRFLGPRQAPRVPGRVRAYAEDA